MTRSRIAQFAAACLFCATLAEPVAADGWGVSGFPLSVSPDKTHLVDATGAPFLVNGEAAWSLIAELTREEAEVYLRDRSARGFNALLVNLLEHQFSSNAPANIYGEAPFRESGNFDAPNEAYFDHAHRVMERAEEFGFLVFLVPAYLGANGNDQGWYQEMKQAGPAELARYASYVARRFADLDNIVWTHGGDWDTPDKSLVNAMAEAIDAVDPDALQTVHSNRDTVTAAYWSGADWLDLDTAYTYDDVVRQVARQRRDAFDLPVIMIEGRYENENGSTPQSLREAAYGAIMAGAAGHIFGNNPIWHFSSGGLFDTPYGWREALSSPGSRSMTHMRSFFEPLRWWLLRTVQEAALCGAPAVRAGVDCAVTPDGRLAVVYLPSARPIRIRPGPLAAIPFCAEWYDPRTGESHAALDGVRIRENGIELAPLNAVAGAGEGDWVFVLAACDSKRFAKH